MADELESWIAETGLDGFNLTRIVTPESYVDFIDLVIPELQRRGSYKTAYDNGSLREKAVSRRARTCLSNTPAQPTATLKASLASQLPQGFVNATRPTVGRWLASDEARPNTKNVLMHLDWKNHYDKDHPL